MYNPTNPSNKQQYTPMPRPNFSAYDIANYICLTCNDLHQYNLTPRKIQKLLYYVQGYTLRLLDRPAFQENIEAWDQGPVVNEVYQAYRSYGIDDSIPCDELENGNAQKVSVDPEIQWIIDEVIRNYGPIDGQELSEETHREYPWQSARNKPGKNARITDHSMRESFRDPDRALVIRFENFPKPKKRFSVIELMKLPIAERNVLIRDAQRAAEQYAAEHNIDISNYFDEPYLDE